MCLSNSDVQSSITADELGVDTKETLDRIHDALADPLSPWKVTDHHVIPFFSPLHDGPSLPTSREVYGFALKASECVSLLQEGEFADQGIQTQTAVLRELFKILNNQLSNTARLLSGRGLIPGFDLHWSKVKEAA